MHRVMVVVVGGLCIGMGMWVCMYTYVSLCGHVFVCECVYRRE